MARHLQLVSIDLNATIYCFSRLIECVASYIRCPLLALTAGDLPPEPQVVEETLQKYFELAALWGAVLVLDRAEGLLQEQSQSDLVRNSIVSGRSCTPMIGKNFNSTRITQSSIALLITIRGKV